MPGPRAHHSSPSIQIAHNPRAHLYLKFSSSLSLCRRSSLSSSSDKSDWFCESKKGVKARHAENREQRADAARLPACHAEDAPPAGPSWWNSGQGTVGLRIQAHSAQPSLSALTPWTEREQMCEDHSVYYWPQSPAQLQLTVVQGTEPGTVEPSAEPPCQDPAVRTPLPSSAHGGTNNFH